MSDAEAARERAGQPRCHYRHSRLPTYLPYAITSAITLAPPLRQPLHGVMLIYYAIREELDDIHHICFESYHAI